jgi:ABC-type sugar transport system ATPase subunit
MWKMSFANPIRLFDEPLSSLDAKLDTGAAGPQVVARVEPTVKAQPREKLRLAFVPDRIHFFDAKTEAVIE